MSKDRVTSASEARAALDDLRSTLHGVRPEELEEIKNWEKQIKNSELWENWVKHPITQQIYDQMLERVVSISNSLSTDETLTEEKRRAIFQQKAVFKWILTLFRRGTDTAAYSRIENDVRAAIDTYNRFNQNF